MSNFTSIMAKSPTIAAEFGRTGRMVNPAQTGFPVKPKSQQTVQKERLEAKHNSRKNQCAVCFTAKSTTGECAC